MQFISLLSVATAMVATASAEVQRNAVYLAQTVDKSLPHATLHNRCDYPVHIWSVQKGTGCPSTESIVLKKGETYSENFPNTTSSVGVSIKVSKEKTCTKGSITQFEYFLERSQEEKYQYNYLDVSYVDCENMDCPARKDGYYMIARPGTRANVASAANVVGTTQSCWDQPSCDKISYVLPDDVQTKTCNLDTNVDFYMCGSEAPSGSDDSPAPVASAPASSAPAKASKPASSSAIKPTTTFHKVASSSAAGYEAKAKAAAVTPAPEIKEDKPKPVKTEIVYVTAYEYVNAKRDEHAHGHAHARRHQPFNA